jgi:uncharacterized protein
MIPTMNTSRLLIAAFGALLSHPIAAASFDCAKAQSSVEKQICADPVVSELDEHLGRYYRVAQAALERGGECLRADQRQWLRETRNQCADAQCLRDVYGKRLRELEAFQPGATEIKSIELPDGPVLAWIFAPGEDELALPTGSSAPFTAEGTYKDEPLHGPTLRTADGKLYVLIPSMLFEGDPRGVLEGLAASGATIRARGKLLEQAPDPADYEDPADAPHGAFDNRECVFVYRLGV